MITKQPVSPQQLRQRAEELFQASESSIEESALPEKTKQLLHELRVHQIELEMQNEELRRAQEELDASQARYFDLYDLAPIGYLTISEKMMIREVNLAAANMFGVDRSSLVKEPVSKILHKADQLVFYQHLKQCTETSAAQAWDMRLMRADGELFWAHLKAAPTQNCEYWITLTDIAARKQIEQDLTESESRWKFALEGAGDGVWDWNIQSGEAFYSPRYKEILGFAGHEIGNTSDEWLKRIHPEDAPGVMVALQPFLDGKAGSARNEFRMLCKDGSWKWMLSRGMVVSRDGYGKPLRMIGTNTDISVRKQSEDDVREASEKVKLILDSTGEAIYGIDLDGKCTFCNASCLKMTGYEQPEQLLGVNMHDLIHHSHADGSHFDVGNCRIFQAFHQGVGTHVDDEVLWRSDGTSFPAEYWSFPIRQNENIVGAVVTFVDITERKQAEQLLQAKNTEMERFTYTVSHDLKSPLITIQSYAGMILKDMEAGRHERAMGDMKRIEDAADKMNALLNDLLELSRVGRQMNESIQVDMNRLVKDTLAQLAGPIKQSQVEVAVQPDLPFLHGDHKRITEVMQNLIENAIKYRGEQAVPRIEIGARQDGRECVFFVKDNGKGIEPRFHESIFGLFKKLDVDSEGTGVGLALVKRIVEVHGGQVWVESEGEGTGSRFCFTVGS